VPPVYQSSRLPSPCLHPPSLHPDLFSSRSFTTLPTNHHYSRSKSLPQTTATSSNTHSFGLLHILPIWSVLLNWSLCHWRCPLPLCVCVSLSLSLSLSLARASELSGSHRALREKESEALSFVYCKDIFLFLCCPGGQLVGPTDRPGQSVNWLQLITFSTFIFTLLLFFILTR
jgi:hypothetical protein